MFIRNTFRSNVITFYFYFFSSLYHHITRAYHSRVLRPQPVNIDVIYTSTTRTFATVISICIVFLTLEIAYSLSLLTWLKGIYIIIYCLYICLRYDLIFRVYSHRIHTIELIKKKKKTCPTCASLLRIRSRIDPVEMCVYVWERGRVWE